MYLIQMLIYCWFKNKTKIWFDMVEWIATIYYEDIMQLPEWQETLCTEMFCQRKSEGILLCSILLCFV